MPKIPTVDAPQVEQRPIGTPYLNERYDASQMGGQVANAMGNIGQAAQNLESQGIAIYKEERDKADTAAVMEAEAKLKSATVDIITKFSSLEGKDALEHSGKAYEGLTKLQGELAGTMTEKQRKVFNLRSTGVLDGARSGIEQHTAQQTKVLQVQSFKSLEAATTDAVAVSAFDPEARQREIDSMEGPIRADVRRQGLPPEVAQQRVQEWKSQAAQVVLNKYIATGDGEGAMNYYAQVKDTLGAAGGKYLHEIKSISTEQQAGTVASAAVAKSVNPATGLPDEGKALEAWDKLPEGPIKKAAFEHVKQRLAVADQIHTQHNQALYDAALVQYQKGKSLSVVDPAVRAKLDNPDNPKGPELWQKLVDLEKADRRSSKTSKAEDRLAQRQANLEALNYFKALPNEEQLKIDPLKDPKFDDADTATQLQISALRKKAQQDFDKGLSPKDAEFKGIVKNAATQMGFQAQNASDLGAYMSDWREKYAADHPGKFPTRKEINGAMADALLYGDLSDGKGSAFSLNKYKFQEPAEDRAKFKPFPAEEQKFEANQMVRVKTSDGKTGSVPVGNVKEWLKANPGGKRL